MIPSKFIKNIIRGKNRFRYLTIIILVAIFVTATMIHDWNQLSENLYYYGIVGSIIVIAIVVLGIIAKSLDSHWYGKINDQIDREAEELVELIHNKKLFAHTEIRPVIDALIVHYGKEKDE